MIARREELAMSQSRAAKIFGGSRTTWINWEGDKSLPERFNYIRIETVLRWEPGSVKAIVSGGLPTPQQRDHSPPAIPPIPEGLNIDPKKWARWDPLDRENIINAVKVAEQRQRAADAAAQRDRDRQQPRGA